MGFKNDLKKGEWAERQLVQYIEKTVKNEKYRLMFNHYSHEKYKKKSDLKKYDISFQVHRVINGKVDNFFVPNKRVTFEIKTDFYPKETNNLIFETKCNNRKSGISATEATFFLYWRPLYLKENIWLMKSDKLKELLEEKFSHCLQSGGDGNRSLMYVIPHHEFKEEFINAQGYLGTYNVMMPEEIKTFEETEKIITYATKLKDYENPIDWMLKK